MENNVQTLPLNNEGEVLETSNDLYVMSSGTLGDSGTDLGFGGASEVDISVHAVLCLPG